MTQQCLAVCLACKGKCLWYYVCIVSALAEQWIISTFEAKNVPLTHLTDALAKLALHPIYSLADLLPAVTAVCLQSRPSACSAHSFCILSVDFICSSPRHGLCVMTPAYQMYMQLHQSVITWISNLVPYLYGCEPDFVVKPMNLSMKLNHKGVDQF